MDEQEYKEVIEDLKKRRLPVEIKETVEAMLETKAEKVVVIKIEKVSDVTDYLVICNGNSDRHNGAIGDEIQKRLKKKYKKKHYGIEGDANAKWILIDYADFVVHVFTHDNRVRYALEKLWMDGKRYNFYKGQ